jgi:hypothetical protein
VVGFSLNRPFGAKNITLSPNSRNIFCVNPQLSAVYRGLIPGLAQLCAGSTPGNLPILDIKEL